MSTALVTSTEDYYAYLAADARPLKDVLAEAIEDAKATKRRAGPPTGPQLSDAASPGAGSLNILVNVALQSALRLVNPDYYIGLDRTGADYTALLLSRAGRPHTIIPIAWSPGVVTLGALDASRGNRYGTREVKIIRGAHDAGQRLTAAITSIAEAFFVTDLELQHRPSRGRRF